MQTPKTQEQILGTIRAAKDSVWVINDSISKITPGVPLSDELKGNLERNVGHLKLVLSDPEITNSGEDLSTLTQAVVDGEAALA